MTSRRRRSDRQAEKAEARRSAARRERERRIRAAVEAAAAARVRPYSDRYAEAAFDAYHAAGLTPAEEVLFDLLVDLHVTFRA